MQSINLESLFNKDIFESTKKEISELYLSDDRPWVIGYSGGKDSTTVVQLVLSALKEINEEKLTKKIYIISSNTLVETPPVIKRILDSHKEIQSFSHKNKLPVITKIVHPLSEQTFWVNIIGRGYPSPNQTFRWCTDRMKIDPANRFIIDAVSEHGEVIVLLGVRSQESTSRSNNIKQHEHKGKTLMKHSTLRNAYVYSPIKDYSIDDVWDFLLDNGNRFKESNYELYKIYAESNSNECPLIIDKSTKESAGSCGNSRFGCWTCTVVDKDKSLTGFIEKGQTWLIPLLEFRNWLSQIRDLRDYRMKKRTNGKVYFSPIVRLDNKFIIPKKSEREKIEIVNQFNNWIDSDNKKWNVFESENEAKEYIEQKSIDLLSSEDPRIIARMNKETWGQLGLGPFTMEARMRILTRLLETQKKLEVDFELISENELNEIRYIWRNQGVLDDPISSIYKHIFGRNLPNHDVLMKFSDDQVMHLKKLSDKHKVDFGLLKKLLANEISSLGLNSRTDILKTLKDELTSDYLNLSEESYEYENQFSGNN